MVNGRTTPLLLAPVAAALLALAPLAAAPLNMDDRDRVTVPNSVHRRLANLEPVRAVAPDFPMERMILVLKMAPENKSSMDKLLKEQQDPASPKFHQWLSPDEFGTRFGPTQAQRDAATLWLLQQGFTVHGAARSGLAITFTGTAATVGRAFNTAIMEYNVDGVVHHGNATSVSLPRALAEFVHGVASLNDLRPHTGPKVAHALVPGMGFRPQGVDSGGSTFIGPGDFATIYNLNPLFGASTPIIGTGVTIGIVAQSDILASDYTAFRNTFNLTQPGGRLDLVYTGADPGVPAPGDELEATLDTQWASATAPGADIKLVIAPSSLATQGVDLSAQYLVDSNIASIISDSWGGCEANMGSSELAFYEQLWAQAAGQGISVFVSTGDSGVSGCDNPDDFTATGGKGVNGIASTIYNTAVGGTMFTGTGSAFWKSSTAKTYATTALNYVTEAAWNDSSLIGRILGGGGGASSTYAKPSWQAAPGVPGDGMRDVPDVALNAGVYEFPTGIIFQGQLTEVGGTSVAAPCMAGIMALVIQNAGGTRQGNANPNLYRLANAQYAGTAGAVPVFHDITTGDNSQPGLAGFAAGVGYDQVTGLGSLDALALVKNWTPRTNPIQVTANPPTGSFTSGGTLTFSGSATDSLAGANLTYQWDFGDGNFGTGASPTHVYYLNGPASQTFTAHLTVTDSFTNVGSSSAIPVTITYQGVSVAIAMPVATSWVMPSVPVTFTAGPVSTQNAGGTFTNASYTWQIYNGQTQALAWSATGPSTTFTFPGTSTYSWPVFLTVTDSTGAQGQAWVQIYANASYVLDQNGDGLADVRDLLAMAASWGNAQATATNMNGLYIYCDINADGLVNDKDLDLWISNFTPVAP